VKYFYKLALILLRVLPPEISSNVSLKLLSQFKSARSSKISKYTHKTKPLRLENLSFNNFLGLAAGLDKEGKYYSSLSSFGFSFIEVGTFTPLPQYGNPKPRIKRLIKEKSLINSLGFNNPGIKKGVENINKNKKNFKGVLGISIGKNRQTSLENAYKDYRFCMQECYEVADYLAVNISSPNTVGLRKLSSKEFLEDLIYEINQEKHELEKKHLKKVPILFKLSPDESDENLKNIIDLSLSNGISGFILTNTLKGDYLGISGGISGDLLKERSNSVLKTVKKIVNNECILISSGGISSKSDAEERMSNGANLIQIYTSFIYKGPEIIEELLN
tara:strand:- start:473 stop:1468 length:996 start_codon:yes stop_codon:yes gene_type:complete